MTSSISSMNDTINSQNFNDLHQLFLSQIKDTNKHIIKDNNNGLCYYIDIYDSITDRGIQIYNYDTNIPDIDIINNQNLIKWDWVLDCRQQFVRMVDSIPNMAICEIPQNNNWKDVIQMCNNNIYLFTKYKQILKNYKCL